MEDLAAQVNDMWNSNKADFERSLDGWFRKLKEGEKLIRQTRSQFHQWDPLRVYVSVTKAKSSVFSLRFFGQEVAELVVKDRNVTLRLSEQHHENNMKWFESTLNYGDYDWRGDEAKEFREHFVRLALSEQGRPRIKVTEHRIESKFIKEMLGPSGKFGLPNLKIQPITIGRCPLQFPVPISASTGQPKKSKGNIDILARHLARNNKTKLSVWELKGPNKYAAAAFQACIYAFTLRHILRHTKKGPEWYKLFGYSSSMPKRLEIEAVVAITNDQRNKFLKEKNELQRSTSFEIGGDSIELYAAYYREEAQSIRLEQDPFKESL
ncbi:MAG: hypothetical protein RTV31_16880 [Candidatus Thorarchaeota archaeon]